jgi:hypothetical protein
MKIKNLLLLILPLFLSTACLDTKQALDLLQSVGGGGGATPSSDWVKRLERVESYLDQNHKLKFERVPLEGDLQSYNIRVPRDASMGKVLSDLEGYEIQLDRFLTYNSGEFGNRAEWQKKLDAIKDFLENYDRKDEYFSAPLFSHD